MQWPQVQNRWSLLTGYLRGRTDIPAFPMTLIIENTGKCNLKCPMCPRELGEYENVDFDFDLFKDLIDQVKGRTELVFPWGGGEPMLNPDLYQMVRYCRDNGIYTVVSTNATILDERRSRLLIESGLDNLIIAFDGTTKEVYEKYRKNARFEKVQANIHTFLKVKKEMASKIFVVMQMVRLPENAHQVRDFQRIWSIEGIDEVRIKEDEIVIEDVALQERVRHDRRRNPCYQLWQGPPTVKYNGDFFPCCHTWRSKPFGNVKEKTIEELWNSTEMQHMRDAHLRGDLSAYPDCVDCHAPNPVLPVILGTFMIDMFKIRQWIPRMEKMALFYKLPAFRDR